MDSFIDGDDLCAGCGRCCDPVEELRVTREELDRLPDLRPYAHDFDGVFFTVDVDGPCPYLGEDRRCGVFATRPFDCSLFPAFVQPIEFRSDGAAVVRWGKGGLQCPHPDLLFDRVQRVHFEALETWAQQATGARRVVLERAPDQTIDSPIRRAFRTVLGKLGVLSSARKGRSWLRGRRS